MREKFNKELRKKQSNYPMLEETPVRLQVNWGSTEHYTIDGVRNLVSIKTIVFRFGNPKMTDLERENARLQKELREAKMERDILKKAISIFSANDKKSTNL